MFVLYVSTSFSKIGIKPNILRYKISRRFCFTKKTADNAKTLDFSDLPGPKGYPIIGSLYKYWPILGDYHAETLDKNSWLNWRRYGGLVRECPGVNLLHVYGPSDIEAIFRHCSRYPARRSHVAMAHYRLNKPHVYNTGGLLSTNGTEWWRLRSAFQKKFSGPQNAKSYVDTTDKILVEFIDWINKSNMTVVDDFLPFLNRLNLEVIGAIAFNERFNSFSVEEMDPKSRSTKIIEAAFGSNCGIMKLDKGVLWRYFKTPLYNKLAKSQEYLEKVAMDILLRNVSFFDIDAADPDDKSLLHSFKNQPDVDLKDIFGMMVDILMASIDTTAYTTSFVLYHIARNPKCQANLFEELSSLLPDSNSLINADLLSKATYLKSCIKESLRLNPVSIGVGRVLRNEIVLNGYKIPKDTVVVTQNMIASRLPQYVKDPLQFKPERWMRDSESYENLHPFLSLPFGFGSRSCIAKHLAEQNICMTIMRLFRAFDIKWMGDELNIRTLLINKPDKPIALKLNRRSVL